MRSKYYKKTRHKIYKKALELYKTKDQPGLCISMQTALYELGYISYKDYMFNFPIIHVNSHYFPELFEFYEPQRVYWWPVEDRNSRIAALQTCINKTKSNKENL